MNMEIRSKNEIMQSGELLKVVVQYTGANETRTLNISGRYELSPEEYKGKSIEDLKELAKEQLLNEINAE